LLQKRLGGIRRSSIGILTTHRLPTQLPQCTLPHLTTPHTVTAVVSQHMVTAGVTQHISVHSTPTNTHTVTGDPTSQRSDTKHGILTDPSHKNERSELRSGGGVGWCAPPPPTFRSDMQSLRRNRVIRVRMSKSTQGFPRVRSDFSADSC